MTITQKGELVSWGYGVIFFVLPVVCYGLLRRRSRALSRGASFAVSVGFAWVLLFAYRELTLGTTIDYVASLQDPKDEDYGMYDGVGGNAFVLLLGWLPPALSLGAGLGLWALGRGILRIAGIGRGEATKADETNRKP